jgi:predicted metalloprotease with PDZ domain
MTPPRAATPTSVRYQVDLSARRHHLVGVTMTVPGDLAAGVRLVMATWTPGSYVMRDYVHHLQQIAATDDAANPVPVIADGHTAFRLPDDVAGPVHVTWELYANDLTVRTNHVDDHHALLVAPATFLLVDGARDREHRVTVSASATVWSLLPRDDATGEYVADDADHLLDSAFESGSFPSVTRDVAGVAHTFVWAGHGGRPDLERIGDDVAALAQAATDLFDGDLPTDNYTFLAVGWDAGGGGLEHRDGSVVMVPVTWFTEPDTYARFQSLLSHEHLHLWNVKRLTPAELVRPSYERHAHTTSLWVAEGWTDYYDDLLPLRAGCWDLERFLTRTAEQLDRVLERPGAGLQSVTEASQHAWTKLYVRDENWANAGTNYYDHGAVLAWCLDLLIRAHDPDGDGLDDVVRSLWRDHGMTASGYTRDDVADALAGFAGADVRDFLARHVEGRELPPVADLVGSVGLEVTRPDPDTPTPWLGAQTTDDEHGVAIATVARGGPAWRGGLTGGDRLLAVNGLRVRRGQLDAVLRGHDPGETVAMAVFRGPRLMTMPVTLGEPFRPRRLRPVAEPTDDQRTAFRRWTGSDLPARE